MQGFGVSTQVPGAAGGPTPIPRVSEANESGPNLTNPSSLYKTLSDPVYL